ncbi:MAG: hypothetical protein D3904_07195, partial [Candidatus Electrothrix sp. EH2]|nr:hypothetical protein [Candidatus Electrothrix sp. EH2]
MIEPGKSLFMGMEKAAIRVGQGGRVKLRRRIFSPLPLLILPRDTGKILPVCSFPGKDFLKGQDPAGVDNHIHFRTLKILLLQ